MNLAAVILAAGQGTRMRSSLPKVLHRVLGRTLAGHAVEAARAAGAQRIIVVVGHGREAVEAELRAHHDGPDLAFAVQAEQRGTGHAVLQAAPLLEGHTGHTLVTAADTPNLTAHHLLRFIQHATQQPWLAVALSARVHDPTGYGRILRDDTGTVLRNVEHRDASLQERLINEINSGVYLFDTPFLLQHLPRLSSTNAQGEYYLPDLLAFAAQHQRVEAIVADDPDAIEGVNDRAQLAAAEARARALRNLDLMRAGVTLVDPASTWIDLDAHLEPDVHVEPGVRITGKTYIASQCTLGLGCVIDASRLEARVTLKPYSHLEGALVREDAEIGPFAHLRPQADIGPHARIGNFVEVKKSTLGYGTKANHLAYIGDATIGARCNIGAGTITCNYDGANKHKTTLGDGVFTGSNSALVAPITLGDGAYVAAGSTVTEDIPADALAVARGRQRIIPGWAARHRARR